MLRRAGWCLLLMMALLFPILGADGASKAPFLEPVKTDAPVFSVDSLPVEYGKAMKGLSWKEGCPVSLGNLRRVRVGYISFDGQRMQGELVVHHSVAIEVRDIFKELYEAGYPIKRVSLVDCYGADDNTSMDADNTSAFNYRPVAGSKTLSKHSYGIALDINPIENPYIKGKDVSPLGGKAYTDRAQVLPGMIIFGDPCYRAFISRGWVWGGDWKTLKDYQHFEKPMQLNTLE